MDYIRKSTDRGGADFGWLQTQHSFSFANYYDPQHMGFSALRVINEDRVAAGAGFDTHPHRDMEIITYILDGAIEHRDSMGNKSVLRAGEVQRMTAGTGITHSEYNPSSSDPLHLLQIWVLPNQKGLTPSYEQKAVDQTLPLTPLVTPDGHTESLKVHQDMSLSRLILKKGDTYTLTTDTRWGYFHIVKGDAIINDEAFTSGDALGALAGRALHITVQSDLEALWFDLPSIH